MEQIRDIVKNVIADLSSDKNKTQESILETWQEVLGKKATKHTKIVGLKQGRLLVNVDSSAWLFQLNLQRKELLEKLNAKVNDIQEISFRIGRVQ